MTGRCPCCGDLNCADPLCHKEHAESKPGLDRVAALEARVALLRTLLALAADALDDLGSWRTADELRKVAEETP